jgi:branched-chain amino acid transport system permease protein
MVLLWQVLANGILLGGLYALMALGLALVWGVLNIVNLAHGAFIMLGAYVCYYLFAVFHVDPFVALPVAMVVLFVLGYTLQRHVLNLIIRAPMFNTLLVTFGFEVVLTNLAQMIFSADYRTINPGYAGANFDLLGATIPLARILAFVTGLVLTAGLWFFLLKARLGRAIRATAQNLTAARLYGVETRTIYAITFGLGAALAGAAGDLYGLVSQINPYIGGSLTAKSFAITIIGGLQNPLGVVVGGIFLGIVESLTALYLGPTYTDVASFGILVLVLVLRPSGLLGRTA